MKLLLGRFRDWNPRETLRTADEGWSMGADKSGKAKRDTQREGERVAETSIRLENGCG